MNGFLKYWAPLYIYAGAIFYVSGISRPLPEVSIPHFDKLLHIFEYAIFAVIAARAFKNCSKKVVFENFKILAVLGSALYGISDEFHQRFVSERTFSVFDMIADGAGAVMGVFVYGMRRT